MLVAGPRVARAYPASAMAPREVTCAGRRRPGGEGADTSRRGVAGRVAAAWAVGVGWRWGGWAADAAAGVGGEGARGEGRRSRGDEALGLLVDAERMADAGDFEGAERVFGACERQFGDLALADSARLGRALATYGLEGREVDAISQLFELAGGRKDDPLGYPEAHAALAAALYGKRRGGAGREAELEEAERQWALGDSLDPRYRNAQWVRDKRHWPPALVDALVAFLDLA